MPRIMKSLRLALLLPLLCLTRSVADEVAQLALPERFLPGLEQLLRAAVQQSPQMLNRALDLEIAENNRIAARANLLPNVGGWANYYEAKDARADLPGRLDVTKIGYNFTLNQPLFFWGERRNSARMGEIQAAIAQGQYRDGYRFLAQSLRSDYLRLIIQKKTVERAVYNLNFLQRQLQQSEERLAKKDISELQIAAIRLAAEQAQIATEQVQYDYEMLKASVARMAGRPPLQDEEIPAAVPVAGYDTTAFERLLASYLGQKELPSVEAITARKLMENQQLSYANVKTRLLPKFSLSLGASQDEQSYTLNVGQKYRVNSLFGGFTATWTIFDGLAAQAATRNELARRRQMQNDYQQLTERLTQQAQTQVKLVNFAARRMVISDRGLTASENTLKAREDDFKRGAVSDADVSQARLALYDAEIAAYYGRMDFLSRTGDFLGTIAGDPVTAYLPASR